MEQIGFELGQLCLVLAFPLTLYTLALALLGAHRRDAAFLDGTQSRLVLICLLVTGALAALEYGLAASRFDLAYVARVTNRDLPMAYKLAALWAGQEGSLLLWSWLLSVYGLLAAGTARRRHPELLPVVIVVMAGTLAFFLALNLFAANPFHPLREVFPDGRSVPFLPQDGQGLNPLLQHPAMVIHPPVLYLGYVGFVVPFAFAMAALVTRRVDSQWAHSVRGWTLASWFFLGLGILLGAYWAYVELGWGGYWAWDPVENASIMPWFTATAFLHSIIVQQRRGMLKTWNFALIIATYLLCILGTFITRSGVISSVHAFAQSSIGLFFAAFLVVSVVLSFGLLVLRRKELKSANQFDAVLSRESGFLFNNFLFLMACLVVLFGTVFPTISEAAGGAKMTLEPAFFNQVFIPIGLAIVLLMGIAPLLAWRETPLRALGRRVAIPLIASVGCFFALAALGMRNLSPLVSFTLAAFTATATLAELHWRVQERRRAEQESYAVALVRLFRNHQRRAGGHIVHLGIVLIAVGLTGAAFNTEHSGELLPGEALTLGPYTFHCRDILTDERRDPNYAAAVADIEIRREDERMLARVQPERRFYFASEQTTSEVALHVTLREDLYIVLAGVTEEGRAVLQVYRNPLVVWLWIGALVTALGALIGMLPNGQETKAPAAIAKDLAQS